MGHFAANLIKACNLRTLVLFAALYLLLSSSVPVWFQSISHQVDQTLFRVGLYFSALPQPGAQITVVHVPDIEYDHWLSDLPGAGRLMELLDTVLEEESKHSLVGLVLERPLALLQPEAEALLGEIQQGRRTKDHLFVEANDLLGRREQLLERLRSNRVVLGIEDRIPGQYRPLPVDDGPLAKYPASITDWIWPKPPSVVADISSPVLAYAPIPADLSDLQYLLLAEQDKLLGTFWTQFLIAQEQVQLELETGETDVVRLAQWYRYSGLSIGARFVKSGSDGGFLPIYGHISGIRSSLRQITLGAALSAGDLSGWILVGRDGSERLERTAQVLASLGDQATLIVPLWWPVLHKVLLLVLTLFVCFVVPLAKVRWIVTGSFLLAVTLSGAQIGGQLLDGLWLSCGPMLLFFAAALLAMLVWRWQQQFLQKLLARADSASMGLADTFMTGGNLDRAFAYARACRNSPELYERLYQIAGRFEAAEQWDKALQCWMELKRRKRRYKDAPARLKQLRQNQQSNAHSNAKKGAAAEPLKLPPAVPKPPSPVRLDQTQVLKEGAAALQTTFGRYQIRHELGRGASGTVYLGFDPLIAREVAIKTLNYHRFSEAELTEVKARFFREAEAAGRLSHPSIVPVFDVGEQGQAAYIAMDFAKGNPLSSYIDETQLLPMFDVYRIALAVAEALAYAHDQKIVHRDIKPGNIMFSAEPFQVRITDFGIARFVDHSHTRTGEILGSPLYMSPEQILGRKVDASADIFSLGVMFYQLLCGRLPFSGDSLASVTYEIVHCKHKSVRAVRKDLPASAARLTNVALQKKPAERYQSAGEMAEAIRKAMRRDFPSEAKLVGLNL